MSLGRSGKLPRLLVIGARGFLGTFVTARASSFYEVLHGDRSRESDETDVVIDITDPVSVKLAIAESRPHAVILLAAISDIDRCQREPQRAAEVNLYGAENVANACARAGAKLLFTSTGAVFDGRKHGYREEDEVSPISVYGETKAHAEVIVRALLPSALVARVSLVLGRTGKAGTNSLMDSMIRRWRSGEVISASAVESRNPIDAPTLSRWFLELLADDCNIGIFHAGATDSMTRYELAGAVAERLHISSDLVEKELQPAAGRAPRGADHLLLADKISSACATHAPSCKEVIERSLNEVAEGSLRTGV
jgi:dTDP-4-dehydrorhamnose reductase